MPIVAVPAPGGAGAGSQLIPGGMLLQVNVYEPVYPFRAVIVAVTDPLEPWATVTLLGATVKEKSGAAAIGCAPNSKKRIATKQQPACPLKRRTRTPHVAMRMTSQMKSRTSAFAAHDVCDGL